MREARKGSALVVLALIPGYFALEGLVSGQTRNFLSRSRSWDFPYTGAAGIVTAIGYGLVAAAFLLAAMHFFSANAKRRAMFSRWGRIVMVVAPLVLLVGVIIRWIAGR